MISIPSTLKTRADYDRVFSKALENSRHTPCALNHFIGLLNGRFMYVFDRHLEQNEQPSGERPEYIVTENEETGQLTQLIRQESPAATIFKLGFTVTEVESIIAELEGAP